MTGVIQNKSVYFSGTSRSFANNYLTDKRFSRYGLWIAAYSHTHTPTLPKTRKEAGSTLWQKERQLLGQLAPCRF
jgi:hypothetical protein